MDNNKMNNNIDNNIDGIKELEILKSIINRWNTKQPPEGNTPKRDIIRKLVSINKGGINEVSCKINELEKNGLNSEQIYKQLIK